MSVRLHRLLFGLFVVWGGGTLAVQAATADPQDGMDAARREFQALKSTPADSNSTKLALPKIDGPTLPSATPAAPTPTTQRQREELLKAQRKAQREKNWLVNGVRALEKQDAGDSDAPDATATDAELKTDESTLDPFEQALAEQDAKLAPSKREARDNREDAKDATPDDAAQKTPNPLDAFMADWISPRDHQLLLPATNGADDIRSALLAPNSPTVADTAAGPARGPAGSADAMANPVAAPSSPADNPYLAGIDLMPPPSSVNPPPAAPPSIFVAPPTAPGPTPVQAAQPPATIKRKADLPAPLAKPADDEKYFPQLKRF